jgi:hypothetical protein
VGIPKGFPQSVERVGSQLHGFPPFPYSVISMACFSHRECWIDRYAAPSAMCNNCRKMLSSILQLSMSALAIYRLLRMRTGLGGPSEFSSVEAN